MPLPQVLTARMTVSSVPIDRNPATTLSVPSNASRNGVAMSLRGVSQILAEDHGISMCPGAKGSELNAHRALSVPPANIAEPCPHTQGYLRVDGSRLCIACWLALAPGAMAWLPEAPPVWCAEGQHQWAPTDAGIPETSGSVSSALPWSGWRTRAPAPGSLRPWCRLSLVQASLAAPDNAG